VGFLLKGGFVLSENLNVFLFVYLYLRELGFYRVIFLDKEALIVLEFHDCGFITLDLFVELFVLVYLFKKIFL
jgi:hypothetical protein